MPLIDDNGIDAVVRRDDGTFVEVQIKARSKNVLMGDAALFAALTHELRENYYFVFYSERLETFWILTSAELIAEAVQNKTGKNVGKRSIWFNGKRKNKETGEYSEHCHERFKKYIVKNFDRLSKA
ncbi:hypothetical protein [Paraglaciecola hydrolytica]|jgi:hypothetical protein|nr:hypothetical protein [Paraglaciecola hydrolytica]